MNDLETTIEIQKYHRSLNPHQQTVRDTSHIHAANVGDACPYRIQLTTKLGVEDWSPDEDVQDTFATGVTLEETQDKLVLPQLRGSRIANIKRIALETNEAENEVIPHSYKVKAIDDGSGRMSPTFKLDKTLNLGGSVDAVLKLSKEQAEYISFLGGVKIKAGTLCPWEKKSLANVTKNGGRTGENLWEHYTAGHDIFSYMWQPPIPSENWLQKYCYQAFAYLHLWDAPVMLLSIILKNDYRVMLAWILREHYQEEGLAKMVDRVRFIQNNTAYKTNDWNECRKCPFQQDCVPDIIKRDVAEKDGAVKEIKDPRHIEIIERMAELEPAYLEYVGLDKQKKGILRELMPDPKDAEVGSRADKQVVAYKAGKYLMQITLTHVAATTIERQAYWKRTPKFLLADTLEESKTQGGKDAKA